MSDAGWKRQEKRIAKETGGKRQPGSGSGWLHQNDVKDPQFLREMKQTDGKSISIKGEDWEQAAPQRPFDWQDSPYPPATWPPPPGPPR